MIRPARAPAFTLLELMVSITIASLMATLAMTAFLQVRSLVNRAESRIAMHAAAQTIYAALHRSFSSAAPGCAMVLSSTQVTTDPVTGKATGGDVTLVFMHAKEDTNDWEWGGGSVTVPIEVQSDLLWEQWRWQAATQTLSSGTSNPCRQFSVPRPNYHVQPMDALPQPRRALNATDAATLRLALDDNLYFPSTTASGSAPAFTFSTASSGDVGDYEELQANAMPALTQVSAFAVQVLTHDGTVIPAPQGVVDGSATTFTQFKGVWQDGRLTDVLTAPQVYAGSAAALRPETIRVRFTLTDARVGLSTTFSYSFALPGASPYP
jgi:prepilin-type N-terminal cleavage/methylation domain-containing protein